METFVNDTPRITLDTGIDVYGYSTLQIRYRKPDGTTVCWDATLCAANDECLYYDVQLYELDKEGEWLVQGVALDTGVRLTGLWCKINVHDPLANFCTTVPPTTAVPTTAP